MKLFTPPKLEAEIEWKSARHLMLWDSTATDWRLA
jgi:hypothetical protein